MSSRELSEWLAFESEFGFPDVYFLTASICSTLEHLWSERPREIGQIVPYFGAVESPKQSPAEMLGRLNAWVASFKR